MIKKIIRVNNDLELNWRWGVEISEIRKDLDTLESLGATHIDIDGDVSYDCVDISFEGYCNREETDKEFLDRTNHAIIRENLMKEREIETYKKLREKYKDEY